ncbi:MAG: class I SAM-dependent methyltransferase [Treponemataceae bacterium]|nr:class I SAM-dependent methyltransferase [Treponemataceae bacterium]
MNRLMVESAEESIGATRRSFEDRFAEGAFYDRQTQDGAQLQALLDLLPLSPGMRVLDLGAGSGYVSFALARQRPDVSVVGLDIVERTLEANRQKAAARGMTNLSFVSYGGMAFPFGDGTFDAVVSRYALHHVPDLPQCLAEVRRVLTGAGAFLVSDPSPNENDRDGFIDAYMRVKPDGHVAFYSADDWLRRCGAAGFHLEKSFQSSITFPRPMDSAYRELMARYGDAVTGGYHLRVVGDEIYVTERVNNMLFRKQQ